MAGSVLFDDWDQGQTPPDLLGLEDGATMLNLSPGQGEDRAAKAAVYNDVTGRMNTTGGPSIWDPDNPVGTSRMSGASLTSSEGKPFVSLRPEAYGAHSVLFPPGTQPVTEEQHQIIGEGSLDLLDRATMLAGFRPGAGVAGLRPPRMLARLGAEPAPRPATSSARPTDPSARTTSFSGSRRAVREAEAAAKAEQQALLGDVLETTQGKPSAAATASPKSLLDMTIANTERPTVGAMSDTPILRQILSNGVRDADRVSTRIPTAATPKATKANPNPVAPVDPHTTSGFRIDINAARAASAAYEKNAGYLRSDSFPDLPTRGVENPDDVTNVSVSHMADNLVWLHDQMKDKFGQETVDRAANWYDGAHQIVLRLAEQTGYSPRQIATVMASLSPQKDWYQNADLGDRVVDIVQNGKGLTFTPEMKNWGTEYIAQKRAELEKDRLKGKDITGRSATVDDVEMTLASLARGGQTFGEINDPDARPIFLRAYDEAHHSKNFPIVTPEGNFSGPMTNADGSNSKIGWGSFGEIGKAMQALDSDDLMHLSKLLGGNHKVRNFYNNIISPNSGFDDTTIDTHAINAAHLRPMGGSHPVVSFGLGTGGSSNAEMGTKGGYGLYHEAYRQAADRLGLLPRQVQSITWEAVRGLFSPEQKRDKALVADVNGIWRQMRDGQITAEQARSKILERASGIDAPTWHTPPAKPQETE